MSNDKDRAALNALIEALESFDEKTRVRLLLAVACFYGLTSTLEGKKP